MSNEKSASRSTVVNIVLIAVGFALLGLAIWTNREKLRDVFSREIDFRLFGLAFLISMLALVATFARWFSLVRAVGIKIQLLDAIKLGFIGQVYNLVVPGAVGGDVIKAVFLSRAHPKNKASAIASMVIDRILGLAGLFLLAGIAGLFAIPLANAQVKVLIFLVWALLIAGLTALFILFTPQLYPLLDRLTAGRARLAKIVKELETAASAYRSRWGLIVGCLVGSACIHSCYVVGFYTVSRALFGSDLPTFAEHFLIVPLVLFTTAVPLPFGALGLSENANGLLFALGKTEAGAAAANGTVAMMAFRTIMYATGLVSLIVYLVNLRWVRDLTNPQDVISTDLLSELDQDNETDAQVVDRPVSASE
jgi:glycosyltransferase 2 family protein